MNRRKFLKGAASAALGVAAARLGIGKAEAEAKASGHGTGVGLWIGETEVEYPWTVAKINAHRRQEMKGIIDNLGMTIELDARE